MTVELTYLTDDPRLRALCDEYWALDSDGEYCERVIDVAARNGLAGIQVTESVVAACFAVLPDVTCTHCGRALQAKNRAARTRLLAEAAPKCDECERAEAAARHATAVALAQQRQRALDRWFGADVTRCDEFDIFALDLAQALRLWALIRVGASDDMLTVGPQRRWAIPASPGALLDLEILQELYDGGLLRIAPTSALDAFVWDADGRPSRFFFDKVSWYLGTPTGRHDLEDLKHALASAFASRELWPARWHYETLDAWLDVAVADCVRFVDRQLNEYRLPLQSGPRLQSVLRENLRRFSVGQMYNFAWRAAKDAAAWYQRGGVTRQHAANTVPGTIERNAERALVDAKPVKSFRRDFGDPGSGLWDLMGNIVFKTGDSTMEWVVSSDPTVARCQRAYADAAELLDTSVERIAGAAQSSSVTLEELERSIDAVVAVEHDEAAAELAGLTNLVFGPAIASPPTS